MTRYDVAVVGPGRVGTTLAAALVRAGHRVVAAGGGGDAARARLARQLAGVRTTAEPALAVRDVGLVLLCTPDDALEQVVTDLVAADALRDGQRVVHVAGCHGLDVLRRAALAGARVAACHPAQTFPTATASPELLVGVAWGVTAAPDDRGWAHDLVHDLGGEPHDVPDDRRLLYHAGLTLAAAGVGAAVVAARRLLLGARVDDVAAFVQPLVTASTVNSLSRGAAALTGPVARGDAATVRAHLTGIEVDAPDLAPAYRQLSQAVLDQIGPALPAAAAAAVRAALDGEA